MLEIGGEEDRRHAALAHLAFDSIAVAEPGVWFCHGTTTRQDRARFARIRRKAFAYE